MTGPVIDTSDEAVIGAQLGRAPRSIHAIAHRCPCGNPDVVATEPRLEDGTPFVVGDPGIGGGRVQHDGRPGLADGSDGDPAQAFVADVVADLEAERVAVERQ